MFGRARSGWERIVVAQRAHITDPTFVNLNLSRFGIACAFALLCLVFNIVALVLHKTHSHSTRVNNYAPFITSIVVSSLILINNIAGIIVIRPYRKKLPRPRFHFTVYHIANAILCLAALGGAIQTLHFTSTQKSRVAPGKTYRMFLTLDVFSLVVQIIMIASIVLVSYGSSFLSGARTSKLVILFLAVAQILMGILLITHNWAPWLNTDAGSRTILPLFQQLEGCLIICQSLIAFTLTLAVKQRFGINNLVSRLINVHYFYVIIFEIYGVCIWAISLFRQSQENHGSAMNIVIIGICLFTMAICCVFVGRLQKVPESGLKVAKINLFDLSSKQRKELADRISANNRIGEPDGTHALGLLTGFSRWKTGDNISCTVVRVYHEEHDKEQPPQSLMPFGSTVDLNSYDKVKAWQGLDEENWIFSDGKAIPLPTLGSNLEEDKTPKPPPITKSKRKRLEKKYKAQGLTKDEIEAAIQAEIDADTPDDKTAVEEEEPGLPAEEFKAILERTEALVLLTVIDKFDLTTEIGGKFGDFITKYFGKGSKTEWLVVRLGLVGAHWPFRPAIFRLSKTKRPVARNAAILRSLTEWNEGLPSKERFGFILAPHYTNDSHSRSIAPGGWQQMALPPTHIADLRPFSGLDIKGYLKAIKYRDQSKNFERDGGVVVLSDQFLPDEVDRAYNLWKSVAHKRSNDGHTATLAEPDAELFRGFADPVVAESKTWQLMFLMVKDVCVASCVLVRLGDTITSDIQGLDYEEGHRLKAYFVMMQSTIDIALKEKISFVEFGPSTAKPKMDIGCTPFPMTGALYVRSPILSVMVKLAAKNVDI
ncbi:uncharacterized protein LOC62_03G003530 [Vanrija pseudolonga]|uniref:BioF2-like acetyltransferase domain-containing protein n=1 Tax=Vanrija pseudolonga TaxID=143232 RepID=A0AAF0Y8R8_9TREE|nr:hypothetical protein LOC62_03G003530 [Vanrija pseudolonga]